MPIRPDQRARYPRDWVKISRQIRFERAEARCECCGECGSPRHASWIAVMTLIGITRCPAIHMQPSPFTAARVILTTAHLDHTPENNDPANLRAMCQTCHLAYDSDHHAATRSARKATP